MDELLSKLGNWKKHLEPKRLRVNMVRPNSWSVAKTWILSGTRESNLVVFVEKVLEVIQFFVVGVSYGSIKNAVASKTNWELILYINVKDVKDVREFVDQLMGDLRIMYFRGLYTWCSGVFSLSWWWVMSWWWLWTSWGCGKSAWLAFMTKSSAIRIKVKNKLSYKVWACREK